MQIVQFIQKFVRDEEGASAIEYALIAALISVAIIGTLTAVAGSLNNVFTFISGKLNGATI